MARPTGSTLWLLKTPRLVQLSVGLVTLLFLSTSVALLRKWDAIQHQQMQQQQLLESLKEEVVLLRGNALSVPHYRHGGQAATSDKVEEQESGSGHVALENEVEVGEKQRKKAKLEKVQERKRRQQQKQEEQRQALIDREAREELRDDDRVYRDSDSTNLDEPGEAFDNTNDAEQDVDDVEEEDEYESEVTEGELGPLTDAVAGRASVLLSNSQTGTADTDNDQLTHPLFYLRALPYKNMEKLFISRANHKTLLQHSPLLRKVW